MGSHWDTKKRSDELGKVVESNSEKQTMENKSPASSLSPFLPKNCSSSPPPYLPPFSLSSSSSCTEAIKVENYLKQAKEISKTIDSTWPIEHRRHMPAVFTKR